MTSPYPDPGSFRDPGGRVYHQEDRVFRTVTDFAVADFEFVRATGLLDDLCERRLIVAAELVDPGLLGPAAADARYVLEHPRLPYVSYPYEWPFSALKAAALLHLDIHLESLERGVTLSDASAYNVQFLGARPVYIDHLSFRRYRDGEFWAGHRQFCEQFLNPLILRAFMGVPHNAWYRGTQEGITATELARLLPIWRKFSWNVMSQVVLQATFHRSAERAGRDLSADVLKDKAFPLVAFRRMLRRLRKWIGGLTPADSGRTQWADYATNNGYDRAEAEAKSAFVAAFTETVAPGLVFDLGCNSGDYARAALDAGAGSVVGFEFDQGALERAFHRAREEDIAFLPLFFDAANPPPCQGWAQSERRGLNERAPADAVLSLAFVHHLAIARNIPLDHLIHWLVGLAPHGVIEFVPKADPMVQALLSMRDDIFPDYTRAHFVDALKARARIVRSEAVSASGRTLFWFDRRPS